MLENILFYFVFLSQILLISFYYPGQILNRISYVLKTFPPSEYPKLYPKNNNYYKTGLQVFKVLNIIILTIGLMLLIVIGLWDSSSDGMVSEAIPVVYFFIQMVPLVLMELSGFAYFKMMRKADERTTRKAQLQPRRLFDYVSPAVVAVAIFMFIACIAFFYSINQFRIHPGNDTFIITITLILSNFLFAGIIFWNLYGKKLDPYQDGKDRQKQVKLTVKSLVFVSIVASAFLITFKAINEFNLDYFEPVFMSLYFQFIIFIGLGYMLRKQHIEDINFEVYKADVPLQR